MMSALLAINWEFELRGILTVIIGVGRADGLGVPRARHQPRRPARLPRHAQPGSPAGWR